MYQNSSFINNAIFRNNIKRFYWIGVLYFVILFTLLPLQVSLSTYINENWITDILYFRNYQLQILLMLVFPVLLGNLLFNYLHKKTYSDMMHSLPVNRPGLFITNITTGITLLVLPILSAGVITLFLNPVLKLQNFYSFPDVIQWCFFTVLINLVFFLSSAFSSVVSENSFVQVFLSYTTILLPVGLVTLVKATTNILLHGFIKDGGHSISPNTGILLPFVRVISSLDYSTEVLRIIELLSYVVLLLVFYFLTKYFYNKRKLEGIFTTISFGSLQFIFKHIITVSSMLLVGILYFDLQWPIAAKLSLGYLIGSFSGYYASEMFFQRSVLVFKNMRGYSIYALGILIGFIFMK